jgi:hypothetical protein
MAEWDIPWAEKKAADYRFGCGQGQQRTAIRVWHKKEASRHFHLGVII